MTQPDISQILAEAENERRRDRARSAQATTTAAAASGDYTTGGAGAAGNLVYLDENNKIDPGLLYPASAGSQSRSYEHVQSTPATTWSIAHMLGGYPPVILPDPVTGKNRNAEVYYPDENHVTVIFGKPQSGIARLSL